MAKLGYTWYPKDWGNSEHVFELSLAERGLYRELIDLAMMNDNKTEIKKTIWSRKFFVSIDELESILLKLLNLNLIEYKDNILFIKSCESRLNMVRGGAKGGKESKPMLKGTGKGICKPIESLLQKNSKGIGNQREIEREIETKNNNDRFYSELIISESWIENTAMQSKLKFIPIEVKRFLKQYNDMINVQFEIKINKTEYCTHFINWLNKQEKKNTIKKPSLL